MRTLISFLSVFLTLHLTFSEVIVIGQPASASAATYLLSNDLTAGALPGGWANQAGTPNWAFDATGLGMIANTVLELDGTAATETVDHPAFADTTGIWIFFQYHSLTRPGTQREIMRFQINGAQADGCELLIDASGRLSMTHGTTTIQTASGMTLNTTYNVWARFQPETSNGALDGIGMVAFSVSTTRPAVDGGGNGFAQSLAATGFSQVDAVRLTAQFSTSGPRGLYAKLRVDDVEIGNNPL